MAWKIWWHVTSQTWFEAFIMVNILGTGVLSGLDLEFADRKPDVNVVVDALSTMTSFVFTFECALKLIAEGRRPLHFFQDPADGFFNTFDFSIVILGWVFTLYGESSTAIGAVRMLRLVRLLTFIKGVKQLRVIVAGVIQVCS